MRRSGCLAAVLLLILILFSSCSSETIPKHKQEAPGILPYEERSSVTPGLLNPDAEVRGIWIASVGNINFPSKKGLSENELKKELEGIIETCLENGLNTVFFQVRPTSDALYESKLFPASEYVSGTQGKSPAGGFDCLEYLIDIAHKNRINVHAWVNPLRVTYGSKKYPRTDINSLAKNHIARKNPEWVVPYEDGKLYFDAGIPEVREYIAMGVKEIVQNYSVDGVVFDDYFYPYPTDGADFEDSGTYAKYGAGKDRGDWRRENINALIKGCYDAVKSTDGACLFGVSPFGIYRNDDGKNGGSATAGLEAYESLYCDALAWARGGYVDYLSPQLYWSFDTSAAPYAALSDWWNAALDGTGVKLLISHGAYRYEEWEEPKGEITRQIEYSRSALAYRGSILYGYKALQGNASGIADEVKRVFEGEIIYSDPVTNFSGLKLTGLPSDATEVSRLTLCGESDPSKSLTLNGKNLNRDKSGNFTLVLSLKAGENHLNFRVGEEDILYTVVRVSPAE